MFWLRCSGFDSVNQPHWAQADGAEPTVAAPLHGIAFGPRVAVCAGHLVDRLAARQDPVKFGRQFPFFFTQARIAGAHGKPVGLADDRAGHDLQVEEKCPGHVPHQLQLLPVLFAKIGPVRANDAEQLHHHGQHAVEMSLAVGAFEFAAQFSLADTEAVIVCVQVLVGGYQRQLCAGGLRFLQVRLKRARVVGQVVRVVVLGGVHVDGHHHRVVLGNRALDQADMAAVQGAHGGHEPDGAARTGDFSRPLLHLAAVVNGFDHE